MLNLDIKLYICSDKSLRQEIKAPMNDCTVPTQFQLDVPFPHKTLVFSSVARLNKQLEPCRFVSSLYSVYLALSTFLTISIKALLLIDGDKYHILLHYLLLPNLLLT
jgi:hypothetical protein